MLAHKKILLVEDDADTREALAMLLTLERAAVVAVESVDQALDAVLREKVDVVVSDINLQGVSGYTFITAMKSDPRTQAVPVIALSGHATQEDAKRAHDAGFAMYLIKPVDPVALVAAIRHVFATPPKR